MMTAKFVNFSDKLENRGPNTIFRNLNNSLGIIQIQIKQNQFRARAKFHSPLRYPSIHRNFKQLRFRRTPARPATSWSRNAARLTATCGSAITTTSNSVTLCSYSTSTTPASVYQRSTTRHLCTPTTWLLSPSSARRQHILRQLKRTTPRPSTNTNTKTKLVHQTRHCTSTTMTMTRFLSRLPCSIRW